MPEKFVSFTDFYSEYLETAYTKADKEAAVAATSLHNANWNKMLSFNDGDSDSSEEEDSGLDSSSESKHKAGEKLWRHSKKGQRPKKKQAITQASVMVGASNPTGLDSKDSSIKEIRQNELREEGVMHEIDVVGGTDTGIEPAAERISNGETSESDDISVPTGPKLSTYELNQLACIEAIKNDPQMLAIKKDIKEIM